MKAHGLLAKLFLVLTLSLSAAAQSTEIYLGPPAKAMTVQDVIKMSKVGLSDDLIVEQLKAKGQRFDLTTDQLIQLKTAKVSERVIQVMMNPKYVPAAVATKTAPAPSVPPANNPSPPQPLSQPAPPPSVAPASDVKTDASDAVPGKLGVYVKIKGVWTELVPEQVSWKSGGMARSVISGGIVKGDVNGYIDGGVSNYRVNTPLELLIVVPEGFNIADYQLLKLREHEEFRDFRSVNGGVFHSSGGAARDVIPFASVQVAPRTYHVTISTALGEYGLLPPGGFAAMNGSAAGKIYAFQLIQ